MKSRINYFYLLFLIFIFSFGISLLFFINYHKKSKENEYFNENLYTLDIAYRSSIDKYSFYTKYIFDESINKENILKLLEKSINKKGEEKNLYKGLLYKKLYPLYIKLKQNGVKQLHFHLKDNTSFLRMHKPSKYADSLENVRPTIVLSNDENRIITGFETGRVSSSFRNVFPLNYNNKHLGSVEISVSTKTIIDSLSNLDKRNEYSFILNKNTVLRKVFDSQKSLYETSTINETFVVEDIESTLPDSPRKLSSLARKINKKLSENKKLKIAMNKGERYATFVHLEDKYYDVTFIPIIGVNSNTEGYLIAYKKSENIPSILRTEIYFYILVIFSMLIISIMVFIISKKTKSINNQKEWFKSITDSLGEGLYVMDSKSKINYINPVACKILGYDEKDIIGKNAHSLFHSHSHNNNMKQEDCTILKGVLKNKEYTSQKEYFLSSFGKNIPVSLKSRLVYRSNNVYEIVTSFSDISIQKQLEEKSSLLTKALEASINCIVITDAKGIVQWANPAFEDLTGYEVGEIVGKNPKELISSGKQSKQFYKQMWHTILNKKPWKGELINKKKDGTTYDEELIITPVLDEDNKIINFIAVKQDISHRKIVALEKEQKDKLFFQQSKLAAMGEMLGNIAHQWRQPLSSISTAATGTKLQKEFGILKDEDLIYSMDMINNSAQYLSETIEDFRSFFDPRNSKLKKFNLINVVDKTLKLVSSQFISKDIEIIKDIEDIDLYSLENELIQVLVNILNNSRDALINSDVKTRFIFISAYKRNKKVFIEIKDNAGGIKEQIIDRIFEPYFTTKHQSQGTGIGLYMSQDIVNLHLKGTLNAKNENFTYESRQYKGAKFVISIDIS